MTRSHTSPALSAAISCGISCTNALLNPTNRSPNVGDSRRANATTDPTERATSCGATTSREHRNASVARACAADEAPLTRSKLATRSTRSRSLSASGSTLANHCRNESTTPTGGSPPLRSEPAAGSQPATGCVPTASGEFTASEKRPGTAQPGPTTRPATARSSMQ